MNLRQCSVIAGGILACVATAVGHGDATASPSFRIVKLVPAHAHIVANGPARNLTIDWTGSATFPITAHSAPKPGCSNDEFKCEAGTESFASGTRELEWKGFTHCEGNFSHTFTGKWNVYLTDTGGSRTPKVTWTLSCRP
jgi:hypothetical protein